MNGQGRKKADVSDVAVLNSTNDKDKGNKSDAIAVNKEAERKDRPVLEEDRGRPRSRGDEEAGRKGSKGKKKKKRSTSGKKKKSMSSIPDEETHEKKKKKSSKK